MGPACPLVSHWYGVVGTNTKVHLDNTSCATRTDFCGAHIGSHEDDLSRSSFLKFYFEGFVKNQFERISVMAISEIIRQNKMIRARFLRKPLPIFIRGTLKKIVVRIIFVGLEMDPT